MFTTFKILFLILFVSCIQGSALPKCCGLRELVSNSTKCVESDSDLLVRSDQFNFFKTEKSGFCMDIYNSSIYIFNKINETIKLKNEIKNMQFCRKCCHLGFAYNELYHSCEKISNDTFSDQGNYFKFGLKHCSVIEDEHSDSQTSFNNICNTKEDICYDSTIQGNFVKRVCRSIETCDIKKCIRKCCPDGHSFINGSNCSNSKGIHGLNIFNFSKYIHNVSDPFLIHHGYNRTHYVVKVTKNYTIDSKGMFYPKTEELKFFHPKEQKYCIEHGTKRNLSGYFLFTTEPKPQRNDNIKFKINGYLLIISSCFLGLTILAYIATNNSTSLFGKTLISFCLTLFFTSILIIYLTFFKRPQQVVCVSLGYLLLYFAYGSFIWMNIICYDIHRTFVSLKISSKQDKSKKLRTFLMYSLFGWGIPFLLTSPLLLIYIEDLPERFKMRLGTNKCFITNESTDWINGELIFKTIPQIVSELINCILFFQTIRYCLNVKASVNNMNDSESIKKKKKFNVSKDRFMLILKLFVIMGLSFIFEVITSAYNFQSNVATKYIEMVWDAINCSQGVFIFIVFVCKRKVLESCMDRMYFRKERRFSSTSERTGSTKFSSVRKTSATGERKK